MQDLPKVDARDPVLSQGGSVSPPQADRGERDRAQEGPDLAPFEQDAPIQEERRWGLILTLVCGVDVVAGITIIVVSLQVAITDYGVSLYCMCLQASAHILSSLLLAARFAGETWPSRANSTFLHVPEALLATARRRGDLVREQTVSVAMCVVVLLGGCILMFEAVRKLEFWDDAQSPNHEAADEEVANVTWTLACVALAAYVVQVVARLVAARKIRRQIVWNLLVASLVSLIFALALGTTTFFELTSWKAEPISALVLSAVLFVEGIWIILLNFGDVDSLMTQYQRL